MLRWVYNFAEFFQILGATLVQLLYANNTAQIMDWIFNILYVTNGYTASKLVNEICCLKYCARCNTAYEHRLQCKNIFLKHSFFLCYIAVPLATIPYTQAELGQLSDSPKFTEHDKTKTKN